MELPPAQVDCVIHFAALKAVGESFTIPLAYYGNNITGACNLLEVAVIHNIILYEVNLMNTNIAYCGVQSFGLEVPHVVDILSHFQQTSIIAGDG